MRALPAAAQQLQLCAQHAAEGCITLRPHPVVNRARRYPIRSASVFRRSFRSAISFLCSCPEGCSSCGQAVHTADLSAVKSRGPRCLSDLRALMDSRPCETRIFAHFSDCSGRYRQEMGGKNGPRGRDRLKHTSPTES